MTRGDRVKRYRVIGREGTPCPRCGQPTEVRVHTEITERERRRPFYYSRWFNCVNERCLTKLIMPPEFIVWNNQGVRDAARSKWDGRGIR